MKAFLLSLVALAAITVVASLALHLVPMSSSEVYSAGPNVRL